MDESKFVLIMGIYSQPIKVLEKYQSEMIKHLHTYKGRSSQESQESTIIIERIKNFERAIAELKKNDKYEIG